MKNNILISLTVITFISMVIVKGKNIQRTDMYDEIA